MLVVIMEVTLPVNQYSITPAMIACSLQTGKTIPKAHHMSIRNITKKEYKRVKSLRKISGLANAPKGLYFVADDNKAYVCDAPGFKGAQEIADFNKNLRGQIKAQQTLL